MKIKTDLKAGDACSDNYETCMLSTQSNVGKKQCQNNYDACVIAKGRLI